MGRTVRGGKCTCEIEYAALPSQARFHASKARFKGFSGPIGSGKSQALCQEAIKLSYINAGRLGLIGAPTFAMLRDATQCALQEILENNGIPYVHNKSENTLLMKDSGSRIIFRPVDDFERLRGTNLAWFGLDELTYSPEGAWLRLEGRLRDPMATRLCGFAVWTPKGHDWVYKRFLASGEKTYDVILAQAMENHHVLDRIPDFYERLRRSYDEKFYRQEVLGEYLNIEEGRVYHAFDRKLHLRKLEVNPALPLLWALDFNVDPMSSVIVQVDGTVVNVLDEIVLSRASTSQACEEFLNRYPHHEKGLVIYGDASGNHRSTVGGTDYDIVRAAFHDTRYHAARIRVPKANPPVRDRVAKLNAKLRSASGDVTLFVHPKCSELVRDFEEVRYKPGSSVIDKERDKRRTHLSDALGYLVWQQFGSVIKAGEQTNGILRF